MRGRKNVDKMGKKGEKKLHFLGEKFTKSP